MLLTYSQAETVIQAHVAANWTVTKVAYENVDALDYSDVARPELSNGQAPYMELKVTFTDSYAAETGPNAIKQTWGYIEATFHTRTSSGAKINKTNSDAMAALFEYKRIGGIVFKEMQVLSSFTSEGWYKTPTLLRFYFNR